MLAIHAAPAADVLSVTAEVVGITTGVLGLIGLLTKARRKARDAVPAAAAPPPDLLPQRRPPVNRLDSLRLAAARIRSGDTLIAIEGESGVGKSTLALELVHRLNDDERRDEWMPDLRDRSFQWIDAHDSSSLVSICRSLSVRSGDQALSSVAYAEKLDALRAYLVRNRVVLFLDDVQVGDDRDPQSVRSLLRDVPHGALVIAAVNRGSGEGPPTIDLKGLEPAFVREMIDREVDALPPEHAALVDAEVHARLARASGGNPRRIRWVLHGLRNTAQDLGERLDALERGLDLEEPYGPTWAELTQDARLILEACAALRGQAILEQLEVATALPAASISVRLDDLVRLRLVQTVRRPHEPNVFGCPDAVQQFVRMRTPQEHLTTLARRLARHYTTLFRERPEDARFARPRLGAMRPVLEELESGGQHADLQALFRATLDLLFTLGLFDDRIALAQLAHKSASEVGDDAARSLALEVISSTHAVRGEFVRAEAAVAEGLTLAEALDDDAETARQSRCRGFVAYRQRDARQALAAIRGVEEDARRAGALETLANIFDLRAAASWYLGLLEECEAAAHAGLAVCEEMPWERAKAYPLRQLAEVAIHRGEFEQATAHLERARKIADEHEDSRQLVRVALTLARLRLLAGPARDALRQAGEARAGAERLGLPPEREEAVAICRAATRATLVPPLRLWYRLRRPLRLTHAPVGGD